MNTIEAVGKQELLGESFDIYGDVEKPLFKAKDIANLIDHTSVAHMVCCVGKANKAKTYTRISGIIQASWFLTEQGVYDVISNSRKEKAKKLAEQIKFAPIAQTEDRSGSKTNSQSKECLPAGESYKEVKITINDSEILGVLKTGNVILPITDLMKAIYRDKHLAEMNLIRSKIADFSTKIGTRKYITLAALPVILNKPHDKDLLHSIINQSLNLPENKKDPVDTLYDGIVSMSNINSLIKQISDEIHKCDLRQSDLLHALENNIFPEKELAKIAQEIHLLRNDRRDLKHRQVILDEQITELKNMGFKGSSAASKSATNLAKFRARIIMEKQNKIYFNRDGSNEAEMRAKIQELSA